MARLLFYVLCIVTSLSLFAAPLKPDLPIVHQPAEHIRALNFEVDHYSRLWLAGGTRGLKIYDGSTVRRVEVDGTSRAYTVISDGEWMYVAFHEGVFRLHTESLEYEKILEGQYRELLVSDGLLLGILTRSTQVVGYDLNRGEYLQLVFENPDFRFHANKLLKTPDGDVYFLSLPDGDLRSALLRFRRDEPVQVFKPDPLSDFVQHPDDLLFYSMAVHNDDIVIVNRHDKLLRFDTIAEQFDVYSQLENSEHGIRNAIFVGDCLVGAGTNGLFFHCPDDEFNYTDAYTGFYSLPDRHQARLLFDPKQNMLWTLSFGSELSGFYLGDLPFLNAFKGGRDNLNDRQPFAVYFDSQGALWVGTNGFGVDKFPKHEDKQFFPLDTATDFAYHVISLYELADGQMLAGSIDGHVLKLANGASDFKLLLPEKLESAVSNFVQQDYFLYFTTLRTLYRFNLKTGLIDQYWSTSAYFDGAILLDLEVFGSQVVLATQAGLMLFDLDNQQTTPVSQLSPHGGKCISSLHQLVRQGNAIFFKGGGLCQLDLTTNQVKLLNSQFPEVGNLHVTSNGVALTFDGSLHAFSLLDNHYHRFHHYHGLLPNRPAQGFNTLHGIDNKIVLAHSTGLTFFDDDLINESLDAVLPPVSILLNSIHKGGSLETLSPGSNLFSVRQADRLVKASFDVVNYFQRDIRFAMKLNQESSLIELSSLSDVFLPLEQQGLNHLHISALDEYGNTLGVFELKYRVMPLWYKNIWFYVYLLAVISITILAAWRYREFIFRNRQNLLKAQVAKQSIDFNREVSQSLTFLRNFIKLLSNDIDSSDRFKQGDLSDKSNGNTPLSALSNLKHKLSFARMLNDGVACRNFESEILDLQLEIRENIGFLVVLYHDFLGKVNFEPYDNGNPLFVNISRDLLAVSVTKLLAQVFLHQSKPSQVLFTCNFQNENLVMTVSSQPSSSTAKPINFKALRTIFSPHVLQYYSELLLHSGIQIKQSMNDGYVQFSAIFEASHFPVFNTSIESNVESENFVPSIQTDLLANATILVVEDNAFMLHIITDSLSRYSNVVSSIDAESAKAQFDYINPDVVLIDLHLPGESGLDFCHWVRTQQGCEHLPVFIMSGDDDRQVLINAAIANANDFIVKPIDFELFFPKLCFHLSQSHLKKISDHGVKHFSDDKDLQKGSDNTFNDSHSHYEVVHYHNVPASSEFITKLMDAVEEIIPQADKTIDDLASLFHTSPRNFRRKVVSAVQMTPKELLKVRRLQHAAELLKHTDLSVTEISYRCGYASQSNFNRQFKTVFDCAPLDYRKNAQAVIE